MKSENTYLNWESDLSVQPTIFHRMEWNWEPFSLFLVIFNYTPKRKTIFFPKIISEFIFLHGFNWHFIPNHLRDTLILGNFHSDSAIILRLSTISLLCIRSNPKLQNQRRNYEHKHNKRENHGVFVSAAIICVHKVCQLKKVSTINFAVSMSSLNLHQNWCLHKINWMFANLKSRLTCSPANQTTSCRLIWSLQWS